MSERFTVVPKAKPEQLRVKDAPAVAAGLTQAVADTYRLILKCHAYHWNVEGPLFYPVHHLTDEQYNEMSPAVDDLAERIRSLGQLLPVSLAEVMKLSVVKDLETRPTTLEMVVDLAKDHSAVAARFQDLVKLGFDNNDLATANLAIRRTAFHNQAAWMLCAAAQ